MTDWKRLAWNTARALRQAARSLSTVAALKREMVRLALEIEDSVARDKQDKDAAATEDFLEE